MSVAEHLAATLNRRLRPESAAELDEATLERCALPGRLVWYRTRTRAGPELHVEVSEARYAREAERYGGRLRAAVRAELANPHHEYARRLVLRWADWHRGVYDPVHRHPGARPGHRGDL